MLSAQNGEMWEINISSFVIQNHDFLIFYVACNTSNKIENM
jgi:hypothetical protein